MYQLFTAVYADSQNRSILVVGDDRGVVDFVTRAGFKQGSKILPPAPSRLLTWTAYFLQRFKEDGRLIDTTLSAANKGVFDGITN